MTTMTCRRTRSLSNQPYGQLLQATRRATSKTASDKDKSNRTAIVDRRSRGKKETLLPFSSPENVTASGVQSGGILEEAVRRSLDPGLYLQSR